MSNADPQKTLWCVELLPQPNDGPVLEELLGGLSVVAFSWSDAEQRTCRLRVAAGDAEEAAALGKRIRAELGTWSSLLNGGVPEVRVVAVKRRDWAESWKEHFHTFRASPRIVVKPSWEAYTSEPGDVVLELDPGMCFGTGYHGTTRACLGFIDELAGELELPCGFLDTGCGSGILSLAAAKLGFAPVLGYDSDPQAVCVARENLRQARVTGVDIVESSVAGFSPGSGAPVVVANILAHVLLTEAEHIARSVNTARGPGFLILSGMLTSQYAGVVDRYRALGFVEQRVRTLDEWTTGCLARASG